ncbi:MAG: zinc ribbon domain-containing protein [Dehalococcoidales bacterium]|nr:zinc ribbon domain-containing protein [Dehalococcoidales bacterium]NLE90149.1 zinc-ribbon domain-containing protein [Dehalococcoidales bacterium]
MECPKCGEHIDRAMFASDVTFCPYCGQDLNDIQPSINLAYCPYCGQELVPGALFCPKCGKKLAVKSKRKERPQALSNNFQVYSDQPAGSSGFKQIADKITRFLTYLFSSERKMRRLYGQWAEYADLSPEEIQALEAQTEMSDDWKRKERALKIALLVGLSLIIIIIIVALLVLYVF